MKRFLVGLLTAVLVFGSGVGTLLTLAADQAVSGTCGDDLTWTLQDGTLTIRGTGEMDSFVTSQFGTHSWVKPVSMTGRDSWPTAPWNGHADEIRAVVIEEGVATVGSGAFEYYDSIRTVTLPQTLTRIERSAFACCSNLDGVLIPRSVTQIDSLAFGGSGGVTVDAENPAYAGGADGVLYTKDHTCLLHYPITNKQKSFSIPDGVTSVDYFAFAFCDSLQHLTVPGSLNKTSTGFRYLSALQSVTFEKGVTEIGEHAFYGCGNLRRVDLPDGLKKIGFGAFADTALDHLHIPSSVTQIDWLLREPDLSKEDVIFPYLQSFYICSDTADCAAKTYADRHQLRFYVCDGKHDDKTVRANNSLLSKILYVHGNSERETTLLSALIAYVGYRLKTLPIPHAAA